LDADMATDDGLVRRRVHRHGCPAPSARPGPPGGRRVPTAVLWRPLCIVEFHPLLNSPGPKPAPGEDPSVLPPRTGTSGCTE